MTERFYQNIAPVENFAAALEPNHHVELPDDWWIAVTDVQGSTIAIEAGNYRSVNTVAAASLIAVKNLNRDIELPFVFGGDGVLMAVPNSLAVRTKVALSGVRALAQSQFGLDLRAGVVQVAQLKKDNLWCRISKYKLSEHINLAIANGRGWDIAEQLLKKGDITIQASDAAAAELDLTGFECRWNDIPAKRGQKLCLVIVSLNADANERSRTYKEILARLNQVVPAKDAHPVATDKLKLSLNQRKLMNEAKVRSTTLWERVKYFANLYGQIALGKVYMRLAAKAFGVDWGKYRQDVVANSDAQKFDGALKLLLDVTEVEAQAVRDILDRYDNDIVYGAHSSKSAILTCLVENRADKLTHFVDGADGGYALAAKKLKAQLKERREARTNPSKIAA
jgi:hypothetical protein